MTNKLVSLLFLSLLVFTGCKVFKPSHGISRTKGWSSDDMKVFGFADPLEFDKSTESYLLKNGFSNIKGGTFIMGRNEEYPDYTLADSNAWFESNSQRVTVASFYLQKTEVTNREYREFTTWVRDSIARTLLSVKNSDYLLDTITGQLNWNKEIDWTDSVALNSMYIPVELRFMNCKEFYIDKFTYRYVKKEDAISIAVYPDTLCWTRNSIYNSKERFEYTYFRSPKFDDYPVVGVSYQQAVAYCDWKTKKLYLQGHVIKVRLPTDAEFEYAMTAHPDINSNYENEKPQNSKSETKEMFDLHRRFQLYNSFGSRDANNQTLIYPDDDGYIFTSPVKSYPPNKVGVYDLRGNVAEWTFDRLSEKDCNMSIGNQQIEWLQSKRIIDIDLLESSCAIDFFKNSGYITIDSVGDGLKSSIKQANVRYNLNFGFWGSDWNVDVPGIYGQLPDMEYLRGQVYANVTGKLKKKYIQDSLTLIESGYRRSPDYVRRPDKFFPYDKFEHLAYEYENSVNSSTRDIDNTIDDFYREFDRLNTIVKKYQALKGRQKVYGGSWANPIIYTEPALIQCFPGTAQKSHVGFRCAVTNIFRFRKEK